MPDAIDTDVAVVGAGPAGLCATRAAAESGLAVALLDDQPTAGGQIYRAVGRSDAHRLQILGDDYAAGQGLLDSVSHSRVSHLAGAIVWNVTAQGEVYFSQDGRGRVLRARHIVLATGATERAMPFPGWTLPGVMTAGAGQILLKSSGLIPPGPLVLAGSGPLLLLLATQYLRAGAEVAALVETTPRANVAAALRHLPGALRGYAYLRKGFKLLREVRRIPRYRHATDLRAEGDGRLERLAFSAGGRRHDLACATLLIHIGVVPNVQFSRALGLAHSWDALQHCWRPVADDWGQTEIEGISLAGDGRGIAGSEAAVHSGRLAALQAARRLGALSAADFEDRAARERRRLAHHLAARPFLDALYAPSGEFLVPADETVVCRCEEVTAGDIRRYVDLGCLGPNQTKSFGRPGMGPCQGRFCGLTVSQIIAAARGVPVEEVGYYRIRPPIKPVTLGEIAALDLLEADRTDADGVA